jgi:hypothetical protein
MLAMNKLRALAGEIGPLNTALYLVHRAISRGASRSGLWRYNFVAQPVSRTAASNRRIGSTIEVRPVERDDPALSAMPIEPQVLARRFDQNAICLGAFKSGRMIGCLWLIIGPYVEDEVYCRFVPLPPGRSCWDFDVFVVPEHRIGLAFSRLWEGACRYLSERDVEWSMSRISAYNRRSLASHRQLGALHIGSALFCRLGRLQLTISSLRPYLHLAFGARNAPEIELTAPAPAGPGRRRRAATAAAAWQRAGAQRRAQPGVGKSSPSADESIRPPEEPYCTSFMIRFRSPFV